MWESRPKILKVGFEVYGLKEIEDNYMNKKKELATPAVDSNNKDLGFIKV